MKAFVSPLLGFLIVNAFVLLLLWKHYSGLVTRYRVLLWVFTMTFLFLWVLSTPYIASYLRLNLERRITTVKTNSRTDLDVVVVLAAGLKAHRDPDEDEVAAPYRVIKGVRVFKTTQAKMMVVSGRWRMGRNDRMVKVMKQLAVDMGVPENKVLLEPLSHNTFEHAKFVSALGEVHASDRIGLVTTAWHMPRALNEFRKRFSSVVPIPCGKSVRFSSGLAAWLPNAGSLSGSTTMIQEYVGIAWYRVRHWLEDNDVSGDVILSNLDSSTMENTTFISSKT